MSVVSVSFASISLALKSEHMICLIFGISRGDMSTYLE